jgi:hypothetical protein
METIQHLVDFLGGGARMRPRNAQQWQREQ